MQLQNRPLLYFLIYYTEVPRWSDLVLRCIYQTSMSSLQVILFIFTVVFYSFFEVFSFDFTFVLKGLIAHPILIDFLP